MRYNGATEFKRSPNQSNGRVGHAVEAVCLHITSGKAGAEYRNAINWFMTPAAGVSAHFVVAPVGDITQCVDTDNMAWANGLSFYTRPSDLPRGWMWQGAGWYSSHSKLVHPTWQLISPPVNPNLQTVSIEMAGQSGQPLPAAQWGALYALLKWLATVYPQLLPYRPGKTLIGHFMLDNLDRPNCPGSAFNLQAIADEVNAPFALQHYRVVAPAFWLETPTPFGPIAQKGEALLRIGDEVTVDQVKDGWAHHAGGLGFCPIVALARLLV